MTDLVANFTLNNEPLEATFDLAQSNIDALFEIKALGTTWGSIVGNITDQTDLQAALNAKQDIIADLEAIRTGAQNGDFSYSTILTYGDIVTYNAAAFATAAQGALAETALQSITSSDVTTALGYTPYNATNPNGYITSATLTDYALLTDIPTDNAQLANGAGYITSAALSGFITDTATGSQSIGAGQSSTATGTGSIAYGYSADATSTYSTAIGWDARATNTNTIALGKDARATQARTIAIGSGAEATAQDAIAIKGINNTANTFQVYTYTLLDMATGLIPDARISSNIARMTDIPSLSGYQTTANLVTSVSSLSTDSQYPSAKCVYDIIGDIESLLAAV